MFKLASTTLATCLVLHATACSLLDPGLQEGSTAQAVTCLPSNPDALVFNKAVCVCESMNKRGSGVTAESYSSFGTNAAAEHRGDVGINGSLDTTGNFRVDGALAVAGDIDGRGYLGVATDMMVGQDLIERGHVNVTGNAQVGGDLQSHGYLGVDGALSVGGEISQWGQLACEDVSMGIPFVMDDPCPCDPASLIDVAAEVAAHTGATPLGLVDDHGHRELALTAGDYYDEGGAALRGSTRISIEGAVRIFVDGDLELRGSSIVSLAEGAELDLYLSGSLSKVGNLVIGAAGDTPASRAIRIFVAGGETIELVGHSIFEGSIYAPAADIDFRGNFQVLGALFARNIVGRGHMLVRFDAGLIGIGEECIDELPPGSEGSVPGAPDSTEPGDGTASGGEDPVCSEAHAELCPGGVVPGGTTDDGSTDGQDTAAGGGSADGTPGGSSAGGGSSAPGGQGSDDGTVSDDGSTSGGGDGSAGGDDSTPADDDGTASGDDGSDAPTCNEENLALCQ